MDESFDIAQLIHKSIQGDLSDEESIKLEEWKGKSRKNDELYQSLLDNEEALTRWDVYRRFDAQKAWLNVQDKVSEPKVISIKVWRYAAAILVPVLMAATIFYFINYETDPLAGIDQEIVPGSDQAVLMLEDGRQVKLVTGEPSSEISQGIVNVRNDQSMLRYEASSTVSGKQAVAYNELKTPRGGTYQLLMSDGTKVTLNAASSIRYPIVFTDSTRTVQLEGEAFFEVAHTGAPFLVRSESQQVRVLGTHFNVKAYSDENLVQTTLIEGSVRIETQSKRQLLKPGEQAVLSQQGLTVNEVNTDNYISWMKGRLQFSHESMEEVMMRLSRWYDFEYAFENEEAKNLHFTGRIDSKQQISSILKMLEVTTKVKFEFNDERIIIQ